MVFFLGQGLLEVSGYSAGPRGRSVVIWLQVRDVHAEHARLRAAAVPVIGPVGQADHRAPGDHMPSRAPLATGAADPVGQPWQGWFRAR